MTDNNSKVIILAAGEGIRLRPLTLDKPKCLIEIFGKKVLEWQLEVFKHFNIDDVSIVTGYQAEKINLQSLTYFNNPHYNTSNMVETLFCARNKMEGSVIVVYGDIIFEKDVLKKLLESKDDYSIIVDKNWEDLWKIRFNNPLDDAESLMVDEKNYLTSIGQKTTHQKEIQGQYIGLMKFQNDGLEFIKKKYDEAEIISKNSKNILNPNLDFEKSYMTDFLQYLIRSNAKLKAIYIKNGWLELDSISDYKIYQTLMESGNISKFFRA
jgi:choline kinase